MHFPFKLPPSLRPCAPSFILTLHAPTLSKSLSSLSPEHLLSLSTLITQLGTLSSLAQSLPQTITTFQRFIGSDNRLYIKFSPTTSNPLGFLKVGQRNLFYRDYIGNVKEIRPTCVLDFYVHQSCQRSGEIFGWFLEEEGKRAEGLAYDRPSEKLLGFLRKHYGLGKFVPQNNNYVVFAAYFEGGWKSEKQNEKQVEKGKKEIRAKESAKDSKDLNETNQTKQPILRNPKIQQQPQDLPPPPPTTSSTFRRSSVGILAPTLAPNPSKDLFGTTMNAKKAYNLVSPWAIVEQPSVKNNQFRTTSGSYGDHYNSRKR